MWPLRILDFVADSAVRVMAMAIAVLMFVEVMVRMFLPDYILTWQEEVARSMLVYMTVVGGALALRDREHFTMPMVLRRFPPRVRWLVCLLGVSLVLLFSVVWLLASLPWVQSSANTFTPALQWDYRVVYAAFPLGALLMTIYGIVLLIQQLRSPEGLELGHSEAESAVHAD
ncbi:MAG: TRAP transporter small permease [Chloroflexi bacterium]|nr:TRAP transporter small permease [Chloroflexota bacterium]